MVAVNNAAAESEGIAIRNVAVNNLGRTVNSDQTVVDGSFSEVRDLSISVTSNGVERIELRHLGRTISSVAGSIDTTVQVPLELSELAIGSNRIVPVAIYADGAEVSGLAVEVNVDPVVSMGTTPLSVAARTPGIQAEYFIGQGGATLDESSFDGAPDLIVTHETLRLGTNNQFETSLATDQIDDLAIRFAGNFEITGDEAGEYLFTSWNTNDAVTLLVDGVEILSYETLPFEFNDVDTSGSIYLGAGQHRFEFLVANEGTDEPGFGIDLRVRGPNGVTSILDQNFVYN